MAGLARGRGGALDPRVKAALVILMVGEDIAADLFKRLDVDQMKQLNVGMSQLSELTDDKQQAILLEYYEMLQGGDPLFLENGQLYLKNLVSKAMDEGAAQRLMDEIAADNEMRIETLDLVDARTISNIVRKEHPQTVALILAYIEGEKSAQVLTQLPVETQVEVCLRMASLDQVTPQTLRDVEDALMTEMTGLVVSRGTETSGIVKVAEMLNSVEKSHEEVIFEQLMEIDPELAEEIRNNMFVFDDLAKIDDRGIQALLKEVDNQVLLLALKTAAEDVKDKIFRNLSSRAVEMLKEDMEVLGPAKLSDVERAQSEITSVAMRLESEGKIVIAKGGGEDEYV